MADKKSVLLAAKNLLDPRIKTMKDVKNWVWYLIEEDLEPYSPELFHQKGVGRFFAKVVLDEVNEFLYEHSVLEFPEFANSLKQKYQVKLGVILWPIRVAISGRIVALPLYQSLHILGTRLVHKRIREAIKLIEESVDSGTKKEPEEQEQTLRGKEHD